MVWNSSLSIQFQVDSAKTNKVLIDLGTFLTGFLTLWGIIFMQSERGRGEGNVELQLVKESRNNFFISKLTLHLINILIKCQVAPGGLVKAEETSAEGNGDVTHFVCLVYTS